MFQVAWKNTERYVFLGLKGLHSANHRDTMTELEAVYWQRVSLTKNDLFEHGQITLSVKPQDWAKNSGWMKVL